VMICADAYTPDTARQLHMRGAQVLISAAAWAPGDHGPNGEWERATADTGLPLFVCNRTGRDHILDFSPGESVVAYGGKRQLSASSKSSAVLLFKWDLANCRLATDHFTKIDLAD
jgi:5-aminopentanamidase